MENASSVFARARSRIQDERGQCFLTRWLFLRLLGIIYLIAFVSLWTQIDGLIGHDGILPADDYLNAIRERLGPERYWWLPTFCWISPGSGLLHFQCAAGVLLSLLLIAGVAPVLDLVLLWAIYLSLSTVCREFLGFQWDILLLETGFLAIFFAPRQWLPGFSRETPPPLTILWLIRWLLFRLMFMSGSVKLLSGDSMWWHMTALTVHYETQPLPTWIGWYAHQLPFWLQKTSCGIMFATELAAPFLIFCGRRGRQTACTAFVLLMLLISLTGNYCFFNLLTVALCVLLLDDQLLSGLFPKRLFAGSPRTISAVKFRTIRVAGVSAFAAIVLLLSGAETAARLFRARNLPTPLDGLLRWVSPLRTVNSYGLFAMMTTTRPEIVIEGSNDNVTWLAYEFKWKPGDPGRRPAFVAPHQPRLDWQMWFEALRTLDHHPPSQWFLNLCVRLLQGSPDVLALLEKNPFPDRPPRYIRAVLYEYHFTGLDTRRATGEWWRRERKGLYCPEATLRRN